MKQTTKNLVSHWFLAAKDGPPEDAEDRLGEIVRVADKKLLAAAYRHRIQTDFVAGHRPMDRGNARDHAFYFLCQWRYARQDRDHGRADALIRELDATIVEAPPYRANDPLIDAVSRTWAQSGLIYDS